MNAPGSEGSTREQVVGSPADAGAGLRFLAGHIDDVVYVVDPAGGVLHYLNSAFRTVFGAEPPENLEGWEERVHPDDRKGFRDARERVLRGETVECEYRIVRPDGSERWIVDRAFAIHEGPVRVLGLAEDITGWRRIERHWALLADTARFLSTSLDPRQILHGLGRLVVPALADWCRIHLLDPEGDLKPAEPVHVDPERVERVRELDREYPPAPGAEGGILDVARTGRSTLRADTNPQRLAGPSGDAREVELLRELGVRSAIIVPLQSRDRVLGVMTLVRGPSCRAYGDDDVELARELAARAAMALDHATLLEAERMARLDAERREAASRLLVRVGALLASPLHPREALRRLCDAVVPELADLCVVFLLEEEGGLEWVAVSHVDQEGRDLLERARSTYDPTRNPRCAVLEALARDEVIILEEVTEPSLASRLEGVEGEAEIRDLELRSLALMPLTARGRRMGVLTLATTEHSDRRYEERDRLVLEEVALRAAEAVDNARLLREAQEARREAEKASRAKSEFLAVASHELRTPLNAIVGYGDLLDSEVAGPVTSAQRKHLSRIRASAWHLLELIEEILSLSKIEAGRVQLELETLDVAELAREAAGLVRPEARKKEVTFRVEGPEERVDLTADRSRVRQILVNLLSNAVEFTDTGGAVVLSYETGDGQVLLHVRDTGPGIPAEEHEAIFEPFARGGQGGGNGKGGAEAGGTGLGLALSRRFARLMGGDVTVESQPAEGSVFTVRLPSGSQDGE